MSVSANATKAFSCSDDGGLIVYTLTAPILSGMSFAEACARRRSVRSFADLPMSEDALAQLCFAAQGVTGKAYDRPLRAVPSPGALFALELYVVAVRVQGIAPGAYHYRPVEHVLDDVVKSDCTQALVEAGLGQRLFQQAAATFIFSGTVERLTRKYKQLAPRYMHMEAGHAAQNLLLQASALRLGAVPIGAFMEAKANSMLGLDGERERVLYLIPVGPV